jgi:hypothetical protein
MSEPIGPPADFGGAILPNPTNIQPEDDSVHTPKAQVHPGGAVMDVGNAPLGDMKGDTDNGVKDPASFPAQKPDQDFRKLSHERPTDNATMAAMRGAGVDMTLDNYLTWAYMGDAPDLDKLDGEDIAMMPKEFQKEVRDTLAKEAAAKAKPKAGEKSTK